MPFDTLIEQHHRLQFIDAFEHALQQQGSILKPYVTTMAASGEMQEITKIYGESNGSKLANRRNANIDNPVARTRRWVGIPLPYGDGCIIDSEEKLKHAMDPTSALHEVYTNGVGRAIDQDILEAMLGDTTTIEGKYGGSAQEFPAANTIAVDVGATAATGLNPKKIRAANKKIRIAYGDARVPQICMAVTANQVDDLLAYPEVSSRDFFAPREGQPMERGWIGHYLGVDFIDFQSLGVDSNGYRRCPYWAKDGVKWCEWEAPWSNIKNDTSLHASPPVIEVGYRAAGGRTQDGKIYEILCAES